MSQDPLQLFFERVGLSSPATPNHYQETLASITFLDLAPLGNDQHRPPSSVGQALALFDRAEYHRAAAVLIAEARHLSSSAVEQPMCAELWRSAALCYLEGRHPFQAFQALQQATRIQSLSASPLSTRHYLISLRACLAIHDSESAVRWGEMAEASCQRETRDFGSANESAATIVAATMSNLAVLHRTMGRYSRAARQLHLASQLFVSVHRRHLAAAAALLSCQLTGHPEFQHGPASTIQDVQKCLSDIAGINGSHRHQQIIQAVRGQLTNSSQPNNTPQTACWN
ncbi:MAG: hypothetical protein KDA96_13760 [Planctomycetaceae bacterium]|nr:hypothetical protein [Planctomycetaceae bacterium]